MHATITLSRDAGTPRFIASTRAAEPLCITAPALPRDGHVATPAAAPQTASPMEVLLSGAAACSAYDVVQLLQDRGVVVERMAVQAHAQRTTTAPKVFTAIHLRYAIHAP